MKQRVPALVERALMIPSVLLPSPGAGVVGVVVAVPVVGVVVGAVVGVVVTFSHGFFTCRSETLNL